MLGDRIAVMQAGRLVQVGTPGTLMREPADDYVRQLLDTPRREAQLVESLAMNEQLALLPGYLTAHLQLTLLALLCSAAVSLPLGVAVTRVRWLEQPALAVAGVIQTIPSLALLAIMVPLLAALGLQSIGFLPAFIGLTLYGVLPMLRNTVTGIRGVDPALKDAARAVGMTPAQQLRRVELPLAMPVHHGRDSNCHGLDRRHRDALDAGRRHEPRQLHLQRTTDSELCLGASRVYGGRGTGPRARRPGARARDRRTHQAGGSGSALSWAAMAALYLYTGLTLAAALLPRSSRPVTVGRQGIYRTVHPGPPAGSVGGTRDRPTDHPETVARVDGGVRRPGGRRHRRLCRLFRHSVGERPGSHDGRDGPGRRARRGTRLPRRRARHPAGGRAGVRERVRPRHASAGRRGPTAGAHRRPDPPGAGALDGRRLRVLLPPRVDRHPRHLWVSVRGTADDGPGP